ncbi:hypothetical protein Tco_1273333 [Tanacetum coccineum]
MHTGRGHTSLEASLNSETITTSHKENYFPVTRKDLKICEANHENSSVNEPPEVELKDLPPHLEYAFLEGDDKLPVIIAKDLKNEEKAALIEVLKSHKRAISLGNFQISKGSVGENRCLLVGTKLDDASLGLSVTAYKTPIGCTPSSLYMEKHVNLPFMVGAQSFTWASKKCNFDLSKQRVIKANVSSMELSELRDHDMKMLIYKEKQLRDFMTQKYQLTAFSNVGDHSHPL